MGWCAGRAGTKPDCVQTRGTNIRSGPLGFFLKKDKSCSQATEQHISQMGEGGGASELQIFALSLYISLKSKLFYNYRHFIPSCKFKTELGAGNTVVLYYI